MKRTRSCNSHVYRLAAVLVAALAAAGIFSACATAPQVPGWALKTPEPDAADTYFTGTGTGKTAAEALANATNNLVASVMQYMGTSVSVQTTATARASLDQYQADLTQVVSTEASGRLAGFRVKDKKLVADSKTGTTQAFILAAYASADLEKERKRIADLSKERIDAVAVPESAGDSLLEQGQLTEAVRKYLEAAVAATAPGVDNSRQKVERNLAKARAAVASVTLTLDGPRTGRTGVAPTSGFMVVASLEGTWGKRPAASTMVTLSLPRMLASGRLGSRSETIATDGSGRIAYPAPAPDFVGAGKVSASLDLASAMELAYSLPKDYSALVTALESDIGAKRADLEWRVVSAAQGIPLLVAVLELDDRGQPFTGRPGSAGLQDALRSEGFSVSQTSVPDDAVAAQDDTRVLQAARGSIPAEGPYRMTYGLFRVDSVVRDGSNFIATASGTLRTLDIRSGAQLHSASRSAQAAGTDAVSAARAALTALGKQVFARELAASLR